MKNFKKIIFVLFLSLFIIPLNVYAYSSEIIVSGQNIGINLKTKGILVVGLYDIDGQSPGEKAGLKTGDMIISINGQNIDNIEHMAEKISGFDKSDIKVGYIRNGLKKETSMSLYKDNGVYKTGLYVKDSISGIGTLTYIDPKTKLFGALGHEIIESSTGKILEIKDGQIFNSEVTDVIPSSDGNPGEKKAKYEVTKTTGNVEENTTEGIFGNYIGNIDTDRKYKVADRSEVKLGKAKIFTVLDGNEVEEFDVDIIKINQSNQKTRNFVFEITDQELLNKTNGIIQGMSGSPIIQGNKVIGAVTHVVVDNPHKGYGIFIKNMLEEAEN